MQPVILGKISSDEKLAFEKVDNHCAFVEKESLDTAISLCQYAQFVITPDTGIYHLSVLCHNRTFVLLNGAASPYFAPYPDEACKNIHYVYPEFMCNNCKFAYACYYETKHCAKNRKCMKSISAEIVADSVLNQFN